MHFFKRGQIEAIGLVIVVILLVVGLLFYVKFTVFGDNTNKEDLTVQSAFVTNLMGSILNVRVCESNPVNVEEGIIACFNEENICGEEACKYIKGQINEIIANISLNKYKNYSNKSKNYSIWVSKGLENKTISEGCRTGVLAQTTIVTANREHYITYFRVC